MNESRCRQQAGANLRRVTEQAAQWYLGQREGMDAPEQADFLAWLRHSPAHVAEYLAIAQLHGDLKAAAAIERLDTGQLVTLAATERAVIPLHYPALARQPGERREGAAGSRRRKGLRWIAAAGVAAVPVIVAATLLVRPAAAPAQMYSSDSRSGRGVELTDGSLLQLDRNSTVAVRFEPARRWIEVVRGAAMIDVGKDPARPLQVKLGANVLQDIGTVFEARREAGGGVVTVLSGRVDLLAPTDRQAGAWQRVTAAPSPPGRVIASLAAGQQASVDARGAIGTLDSHIDVARATAWLPSDIRFQHSTVEQVARRFNAYTTQPLLIEDPRIAALPISGRFHAHDTEGFVAYLASLPGVQVERDGRVVRVLAAAQGQPPL